MSEKKRIACFFTGGFTEVNSMKIFMRKINDRVEYIQLCPTGPKRSKTAIRCRHTDNIEKIHSGLTGEALIDYIIEFTKKKTFKDEKYDVILIEDDKDDRFLSLRPDGTGENVPVHWEKHKENVRDRIHDQCPGIPVLFFYAAPEVESWFVSDWDNSFGKIYEGEISARQNNHFSVMFHRYVNENILTFRYREQIEDYGYFDGNYRKLSEQLQNALAETDYLRENRPEETLPVINYSKRKHGEKMLEQIDPQNVLRRCSYYFREGFWALQAL